MKMCLGESRKEGTCGVNELIIVVILYIYK